MQSDTQSCMKQTKTSMQPYNLSTDIPIKFEVARSIHSPNCSVHLHSCKYKKSKLFPAQCDKPKLNDDHNHENQLTFHVLCLSDHVGENGGRVW